MNTSSKSPAGALFWAPVLSGTVSADTRKMIQKTRFSVLALFFSVLIFSIIPHAAEGAELSSSAPGGQKTTPVILAEISECLAQYKYNEAIALFDTIDPADAADSNIQLLKASVLSSAGKAKEARPIAEALTTADPGNLEALFVLAAIEGVLGREKEQKALLEKIIQADPKNAEALTSLGALSLSARSYKNAGSYFDRALEAAPENLNALLGRARVFRLSRDPQSAEPLLTRAVTAHPGSSLAWHERARMYRGVNKLTKALEDLDKAKELNSGDYWIAIDRGKVLLELNRKPQALEEYERAVKLNPNEFLAYVYTAGIKDDLKEYEGAERDYEILAKLRPDYYYAFEGVGMHKLKRGQWEEARNAFLEVFRQIPTEYSYALLASISWMKIGNLAGPRQFISQVMSKMKRDIIDYQMMRLYYDLSGRVYAGETTTITQVEQEKNPDNKARMIFYLAFYYDIRGNKTLADKYFLQFKDMDRQAIPEWRLNEWILEERNLKPF
jgi:tetratricopeptide (TPR) repeat protein